MITFTETKTGSAILDAVIAGGIESLTATERGEYYRIRCEAAGLDWRSQPFQFLMLKGKLVLYATKGATQQLAMRHKISTEIVSQVTDGNLRVVTVRAKLNDRVTDEIGVVAINGLSGEDMCNALMKAVTKAKRRAVLALCGLSEMDESEIETVPGAERVDFVSVVPVVSASGNNASSPSFPRGLMPLPASVPVGPAKAPAPPHDISPTVEPPKAIHEAITPPTPPTPPTPSKAEKAQMDADTNAALRVESKIANMPLPSPLSDVEMTWLNTNKVGFGKKGKELENGKLITEASLWDAIHSPIGRSTLAWIRDTLVVSTEWQGKPRKESWITEDHKKKANASKALELWHKLESAPQPQPKAVISPRISAIINKAMVEEKVKAKAMANITSGDSLSLFLSEIEGAAKSHKLTLDDIRDVVREQSGSELENLPQNERNQLIAQLT